MHDKHFGVVVRARREELQLTLRKFAISVDMSPTYLSKVERGEFPPPAEKKILAIAAKLKLNPDELLGLAGRVPSDVARMIHKQPVEFAGFLRMAGGLPKSELERFVRELRKKSRE